jgi:hypothetical protein
MVPTVSKDKPVKEKTVKENKGKDKKTKTNKNDSKNGIASYFSKPIDLSTPQEAVKLYNDNDKSQVVKQPSQPVKSPKKPTIKAVVPPEFHPVRAACSDNVFQTRLKIREFVLKCKSHYF